MFKKKAHIKPFAPLRSSDRRKLANSVISDFQIPISPTPNSGIATPVEPSTDAPTEKNEKPESTTDPALTRLRNTLFPDNTASAKFQTTQGPDLAPLNGIVYVGTHPETSYGGGVQRPLWVKTYDVLFPTLYTLFETPTLLPIVHTHAPVMEKIQAGADLMTPGLVGPPFDERAKEGRLVAIADVASPTVPLAVGITGIDISGLTNVRGEKGKAVRVLHWVGDELWSLGGKGGKVPDMLDLGLEEDTEDGGVKLDVTEGVENLTVEDKKEEEVKESEVEQKSEEEKEYISTKDIDNAFRDALIYSLHMVLKKTDDTANLHHSMPFPLSSSYALKELVVPKLPSHSSSLQIGKTSWKKIQKMLKAMDKLQIIKIKERSGDVFIYAVNWDNDLIRNFKPYPLPKAKTEKKPEAPSKPTSTAPLKITELYKPPSKLLDVYEATNTPTKELLPASDVKSVLTAYFTSDPEKSLVSKTNARMITINPLIAKILFDDSNPTDAKLMVKGEAPRDLLIERFLKLHTLYYQIHRGDELLTPKPKSGSLPKVTLTLENIQGNKVVSKIKGLEVFDVDVTGFAAELRPLASGSTTVHDVVGAKPADQLKEIQVQGNQQPAVEKLLDKHGITRRYLNVENKIKTKGKKPNFV